MRIRRRYKSDAAKAQEQNVRCNRNGELGTSFGIGGDLSRINCHH